MSKYKYRQERRDEKKTKNEEWVAAVFKRDNYTCVKCGSGIHITAHHIVPRVNTRTRYLLENGITLCKFCHGIITVDKSVAEALYKHLLIDTNKLKAIAKGAANGR